MLKTGTIIGERYEVIGKIGAGGMADVYKAKDAKLNRFVAVKVMKSEFREDKTFIRKFKTEAQSAAGLANPNIVNVFDVGDDNGIYFIVMELVEGITLKEYIAKKGRLSVREATSIAIQVCMGLAAAHAQGIIHRDVKPQNIIISTDGKVKVTDFGIARAASSNTISSNAMGSVHYSSPEQVRGGYSDAKSDIYSVGITIYEMVTGRVPFDGDTTVAIAIKHLQEEMEAPSKYVPDLPHALEQIIFKCTQKSVDRRYNDMTEVIADLKHSLIEPDGDFVSLVPLSDHAQTVMISPAEMDAIKAGAREKKAQPTQTTFSSTTAAQKGYEEEEDVYDDDDDDEYDDDDDEGGISSKLEKAMTIGGFVIGALIICILIYFVGQAAGIFKFPGSSSDKTATPTPTPTVEASADTVDVPNLVGMTADQATAAANEKGLGVKQSSEAPSDTVPAGQIISTDPAAGTAVAKNTTITYVISSGTESITIPEVVGSTLSEAQTALGNAGFTNISVTRAQSNSVDVGNVISVSPDENTSASASTQITLTVSTGSGEESEVTLPSVGGLTEEQAKSVLEGKGLVVTTTTGKSDRVAEGEVITMSPASGTKVAVGSEVTLTINSSVETGNGDNNTDEVAQNQPTTDASGTWQCDEQLDKPANYTGGDVKLELVQTVNGEDQTTTVYEGSAITFPYSFKTNGAAGISTGRVNLYEMVDGGYKLRAYYPMPFSQVS
ncbi:MAG: Stk1 family PASTA domain-containing Ser/Thr kinase [Lachnospiraceae bacterium]|nr:Stk1 family PASTA domain-containing Ser/Thr kinase [Lachnospiraceae bacterium]